MQLAEARTATSLTQLSTRARARVLVYMLNLRLSTSTRVWRKHEYTRKHVKTRHFGVSNICIVRCECAPPPSLCTFVRARVQVQVAPVVSTRVHEYKHEFVQTHETV